MRMQAPKEDPAIVAERERERMLAQQERTTATQDLAAGMTSDFRRAYMPMSLFKVRG